METQDTKKKEEKHTIAETKEKIVVASDGLSFFERLLELNRRYSIWEVIKTLITMAFVIWFGYLAMNPTYIIDKYDEIQKREHAEELHKRFDSSKELNAELSILLNKLHADRVFFIEYHNSIKSLEGAPFAYGSMNFEETSDGVEFIGDEYTNFSLAKYKMVQHLYENLMYIGDVKGLEDIDKRLSLKLVSDGIKQIALIEVEGIDAPLGILGVTWSKHDVMKDYKDSIKKELRSFSVKIAYINKHGRAKI